jgi:hypothetical protein
MDLATIVHATGTMHAAQRTVLGDRARSRLRRTDAWGVERHTIADRGREER